ncbi:response regulator transcription factor [Nocardia alni]|uniref:response regulator transcription factor n=1 Tax=Nocardia alni TaxID=2815723 RepID=UPI001C235C38|nr:response regulator transcription factor [Nocardia alni]
MRLLVVDDDKGFGTALVGALTANRHHAVLTARGTELLRTHNNYDAVILDLTLPDIDGIQLLRQLRQLDPLPVLVLTADTNERTAMRALRNGADDYMTKPPRLGELIARLERAVWRSTRTPTPTTTVTTGDVRIDLPARHLDIGGSPTQLTRTQFELLKVLTEQPGTAVSRQQLMDRVWGNAFLATSRSLDVHISALRAKLARPDLITTIRGYGYRWGPPAATQQPDRQSGVA